MNSETLLTVAALIVAGVAIVILLLLYKRGFLSKDTISFISKAIDALPKYEDTFLSSLVYWCRLAVDAVDQMVKNGTVKEDDNERKGTALSLVMQYAAVDGKQLTGDQFKAADSIVESIIGREHKEGPQPVPLIAVQRVTETATADQAEEPEQAGETEE
ncbi:MAG: hypothetical protein IJ153_05620 [Clostridia bacterium]|nr:hypothetical protein [Clostridia bacterium]MBQ9211163.1 hypothetical protein [Clostridia bacterium]